jgi:cell division septum initiation protein DivIVA
MNENSDLLPNLLHEEFEMQMRGYSRRQVDDFVARRNAEIRDLEQRTARALDETEHLHRELAAVRQQALAGRPAHEEVSERIAQILKLADDEARAQKSKADEEIGKMRAEAQQESERVRADSRDQAERMLTAAQEQAERTISAARAEADKTRTAARDEAERLTTESRKQADAALAKAKAQAKKVLDEATARATAIHDGAERRLNLLSSRHAETVRRLADILDGVQGLVAAENARMTLEEEVSAQTAKAIAMAETAEREQAAKASQPASAHREDFTPADLALLAPPAPETVANGAPALGRPAGGRPGPSLPDSPSPGGPPLAAPSLAGPPLGGPVPGGPALPPPSSQSLPGLPPPGMSPRPGPAMGNPGHMDAGFGDAGFGDPGFAPPGFAPPGFGGPALPGPGMPPPPPGLQQDRDRDFDPLRDPIRSMGTIDPDEPTEGIRMLP